MPTSPLSLRPDYPGDEKGGVAVPRGVTASPRAYRTYYYSPGRETPGPYGAYSRGISLDVMSSTDSSQFEGSLDQMRDKAEKYALDDAKKAMQAAEHFLDGKLRAEGYRFSKEERAPRLRGSQGDSVYSPKAMATISYSFAAPTERWKEIRPEGEVEIRGVRDPFPLVPIAFLEGLRKPLGNAIGAEGQEWWDAGGLRWRHMASRIASQHLAGFRSYSSARSAGMATNLFDGWRKQKVLNVLNALLGKHTKGQFRDTYWAPIQAIRADFDKENIPAEALDGSGRYEKENGVDVRKVWKYKVPFRNQNGREDAVYVSITASGAGPVDDPLAVYDVVAYAS